jgi:hypothetical protein
MTQVAFAYAQVRLQSRHAERPGPMDWRVLQGVGDVVHYLQVARRTRLRRWVTALHGGQDSHQIELSLRRQFCDYTDEVARWLPRPWNETLGWVKRLPDLPAIRYLLNGELPPAWMQEDPRLQTFANAAPERRLLLLEQSDCAPLVAAWRRGESLTTAWLEQWRKSWPADKASRSGLERLVSLLQRSVRVAQTAGGPGFESEREALLRQLTAVFRRYSFRPAACYAHLALTGLDLMSLRAELLRRLLFPVDRLVRV